MANDVVPSAENSVIVVVAAVVRRGDEVLVGLRPRGKRHGGRWEFPGGKVREGESLTDAIARELREELGLEVTRVGEILFTAADPGSEFEVQFVEVEIRGVPRPTEHEAVRWVDCRALGALPLAPADERFAAEALGAVVSEPR